MEAGFRESREGRRAATLFGKIMHPGRRHVAFLRSVGIKELQTPQERAGQPAFPAVRRELQPGRFSLTHCQRAPGAKGWTNRKFTLL